MTDVLLTPDVLLMGKSKVESADSTPDGWVPAAVEKTQHTFHNWQYAGRRKVEKIIRAIQKAMIETPEIDYAELVSTRSGIWTFFPREELVGKYTNDSTKYTNDYKGYKDWVEDMANCARTRNHRGLERRLRRYLMSALEDLDVEDLVAVPIVP